jgi:superfamily II DNA helicase RecQ
VIDGAHCLADWGEFHPEYKQLGRLRYVLPGAIPFLVMSPALTKSDLNDAIHLFHMHMDRTHVVHRSSDRPNIKIGVKKIAHPLNSFADLAFLILAGFMLAIRRPNSWSSLMTSMNLLRPLASYGAVSLMNYGSK